MHSYLGWTVPIVSSLDVADSCYWISSSQYSLALSLQKEPQRPVYSWSSFAVHVALSAYVPDLTELIQSQHSVLPHGVLTA